MRFGKHPAKHDYRTLRFGDYVKPGLPAPAQSFDGLQRVYKALNTTDVSAIFPMDGNDQIGDCTIAGRAHANTIASAYVGKKAIMTTTEVEKIYRRLSGGQDTGLNMLDVLNDWQTNSPIGIDDEIMGFVSVDPKNQTHVCQAIQIFGFAYLGFQVGQEVMSQFAAKVPWTPSRLMNEGHCVIATGWSGRSYTDCLDIITWAAKQPAEWSWWYQAVDECYAAIPAHAADPGFAPGFDMEALQADLAAVAN